MAILTLREVTLDFGGPPLIDHVDWTVDRGERICLLGRNGEGKSTLLKLIDGELSPDSGEIVRQQGIRVARLQQEVPRGTANSIFDEVADGLGAAGHEVQGAEHRVEAVLSRMELPPEAMFPSLSAGMKRRVLLAKAIVGEPDILLLDEPTNHLDIDAICWLEDFLLRFAGTLIFVTHDRTLLERLATRIVELDRGRLFDWRCDYPTFLERKEAALAAEARQNELFDKRLAQEEAWIRKGIEARRTRNEGRVRALKAMREERRRRRDVQGVARIEAQQAEASGRLVIEAKGVNFAYGERLIVQGLTTSIMRGDKVGIIGPNGTGKTTLLRLLLGELPPREGTVRHGTRLEVAYFDQLKATLDEERTVQQNVTDYETITFNGQSRHILGYLQDFLFMPERSRTLVKFLSGGERSRLLLARLFTKPSNVLVFDEPTNDLDIETLELLESLLAEYQGTVLLVSHDRAFLNDVVTSTLAIETGGTVHEYAGGYDDYLLQRPASAPSTLASSPAPSARKAARPQQERPPKLSYKEKQELAALPQRIEKLEAQRRDLHEAMANPAFYQRPGTQIAEDNAKLSALEHELRAAYERWEALEALAE
ncbi:MAG TPA: ATP-binding cassette domain-containing protein [Pirellulales bacterium]|nr:ATP-binding cassette domain-containing protein [Pirellulales bacterium]